MQGVQQKINIDLLFLIHNRSGLCIDLLFLIHNPSGLCELVGDLALNEVFCRPNTTSGGPPPLQGLTVSNSATYPLSRTDSTRTDAAELESFSKVS
jgi:hypothetical protein